jgi:gamma-glutamyltranspeptidase
MSTEYEELKVSEAVGRGCAIASPHMAATKAGVAAFERGGTAVDAAIAAAAVYPHMATVGGDVIALVDEPDGNVAAYSVRALRRGV